MRRPSGADVLFAIQLLGTIIFGGAQLLRALHTTEGINISWYGFWEIFLIINLNLALAAHRAQRSKLTLQTILTYSGWLVVITANLIVIVSKRAGLWNTTDTFTTAIACTGILATFTYGLTRGLSITDPIIKGWYALFFKAVPQFLLAWHILKVGGAGLTLSAILAGHLNILIRIAHLVLLIREAGWDRNRVGSFISEVGNELSWLTATAAWLIK